MYHHSTKTMREQIAPDGRTVRSYHPTKGWRYSRIAPASTYTAPTLARRMIELFRVGSPRTI